MGPRHAAGLPDTSNTTNILSPKKNPSNHKAFMNLEILNWCRSPSSGSRLVGHAEPHAGQCDLRDEQRDLPHFRKVEHSISYN